MRTMIVCTAVCSAICVIGYYISNAVLTVGIVAIVVIIAFGFYKKENKLIIMSFFVILTVLSILTVYKNVNLTEKYSTHTVALTFTATENCKRYSDYRTVKVVTNKNDYIQSGNKFEIFYYDKSINISAGDIFKAKVKFKSLNGSEYKMWNYSEGIYAQCNMEKFLGTEGKNKIFHLLQRLRNYVTDTLFLKLPYNEAATLNAITIGDRSHLSDEFYSAVKITGVSHVMVVSGLHLSIIMGGIYRLIDKLFYNKYLRFFVSLMSVTAIIAVCGFTTSVIRAGTMYIIASFAPLFNRESDTLNNLATAVTLIIISSPFVVFNVGFQLSVLCTFGVIYIAPFFIDLLKKHLPSNVLITAIIEITLTTLSATFMAMPVLIYNFGFLSLISPVTNILISYAVTGALLFIVLALLLYWIPFVTLFSEPFFISSGLLAKYINNVIMKLSKYPFAVISIKNDALIVIITVFSVLCIIAVLLLMYACKMRSYLLKLE